MSEYTVKSDGNDWEDNMEVRNPCQMMMVAADNCAFYDKDEVVLY
jgi:hypothetical protein